MKKFCILALFLFSTHFNLLAQNLSISSTGQTGTSGSNWSILGNVLTVTGTANVRASVIQDHLTNVGPLEVVGNTSSFAVTISEEITVTHSGNELVFGASGNTGNFTGNAAISTNGSISIYGGIVTANQNLTSTASGADILLQANNNIVLAANRTIETNAGDITFRANAGGTAATSTHAILLNTGTSLLSTGGNITLGGNFDGTEGAGIYAAANVSGGAAGIRIDGSTITAAGGNVSIYGRCVSSYDDGIRLYGNITTTGTGSIGIYGDAYGGYSSASGAFYGGITLSQATRTNITAVDGNVVLRGVLTNSINTSTAAINFYRNNGSSSGGSTHIQILSQTGNIEISGDENGTGASGIYHASHGNVYIGSPEDASWIATGDVRMIYSRLDPALANGIKVRTQGAVSYEPKGDSFTIAQTIPVSANNVLAQDASSLTIGKPGNTANINIGQAQTIAGDFTLHGGALALNAAITATNADINLHASGNVTQNAAGILTANNLGLHGTGNFTLTNTSNNVITIAGGDNITPLGNLSFVDASGGLEIGSVNPDGITSTGNILIETLTGDIQLNQPISTTSNTTTATGYTGAIVLNAGKNTAVGIYTGGDIKVGASGSVSAPNGITKLYSGLESLSTGLTTLVGGTENTRSSVDETTSAFSPVLSAIGGSEYALYRIAAGTGDLTIVSSGGDTEGTTWSYSNGVITTLNNTVNLLNTDLQAKFANGNVTIEAGKVTFSANVTNSTSNAFKVLSKSHILNTNPTTITTQGGDILLAANVDDATDGESAINGQIRMGSGLSITTNGGDITLGGGDNEGSGYAMGQNFNNLPEGIRIDGTIALNSGGGNIEMRGKTPAVGIATNFGGAGIMFYNIATGSINSGTGTILMDGYSQTSVGNAVAGLLWWSPGASNFTIESANPSADAITLNGFASGASGQAYGVETEAFNTLNILATASGGGITLNTGNSIVNYYDAVFRGPLNVLAVDGPIALKGGQLGGVGNGYLHFANNVYLGSKASTAVTSSSSDILIEFDRFDFPGGSRFIATDGAVTWQPNGVTFGMAVNTNFFSWNQNNQTMSGLTIGKLGNTFDVTHNTPITVAGPVSMYGGRVSVASNLTSSADGDIFIKAITGAAPDIQINAGVTVAKTGGTGTLTLQGHGRVNQHGTVTATAPGVLNVVLWSDFDDDNDDGGTDMAGSITTNGGHVWLGGSNSNGGSYTWNGLTVGDGPSVGNPGNNFHALDLAGNVTTNGGHFLAWAGTSWGVNGIATVPGSGNVINTGSGDITLIANQILGQGPLAIKFQTTGVFSLVPNGGAFPSGLNWNPVLSSGNFDFSGNYNYLDILNVANLGGLVIGRYDGMIDGTDPVVIGNTADVTINTATSIAGPISVYGGTITLNSNLTTTNDGDISLYTDNALGGLTTPRTLTAAGAFKYIPRGTTFSADVTYPIANLTATSTGLTIGNATNDKNITINADVTGGAGIELYGNNVNINSNLKTTNSGNIVLKGNTTIAAGKYIESNGNFTHDGNITFKSDANGSAAFGPLGGTYTTTSGTVQVERFIPARRAFRFLTSSVTTSGSIFENWQENGGTTAGLGTHITGAGGATNGFDVTATNNPSMFGFNHNTGQWAAVTNTNVNTLTAGTPYRLMVRGDRNTDLTTNTPTATATTLRATGSLKTGDFTPALNQAAEGFSFIGNPYQAPLDMEAVLTNSATNIDTDVLYYWDPTLNTRGAYVTRTLSANTNTVQESSFTEILQPGQAVFVKKDNTATAATMTISETHKNVAAGAAGVFRTNANNTQSNAVGLLRANLQATIDNQWQTTDAALALFATSYTWDVTQEDATKMNNLDEEVSFVQNNTSLAIAKQNDASVTDELPIRLQQLRHTNYRWVFDLTNYSGNTPYLLDTEQNTLNVIENGTVFPFTAGSNATNRFKIVFQNTTLTTDDFLKNIKLYPNPAKAGASFYVAGLTEGTVSVYNVVGQNIPVTVMSQGNAIQVTPTATLSQGIYLVSLTTTDGKTAQVKWIVE